MTNSILIIGGGPTGLEAAASLAKNNYSVTLFEKEADLAIKIKRKYCLFPNFAKAEDIANQLIDSAKHPNITIYNGTEIVSIKHEGDVWEVEDQNGKTYQRAAVPLCTGYETFDARRKEELGYGIYDGVITFETMETMLKDGKFLNAYGEKPNRIVFLRCVGSRDEKSGNHYCSRVCCITAVKQTIEVKKQLPNTEVYIFYMDLRMWGQHFEEMYRQSQEEYDVRYVRGRISEAGGTFDG